MRRPHLALALGNGALVMGAGLRGRGLGMGERPGSLEAGLGELAPRGAGLQRQRDLQFGLPAPQSLQFPPLWWPRGPAGSPRVGWPLGLGAGPAPPLSSSVGPRRSGPRRHGALSCHGGLGDHSPGEPPGPRRRRWRPALEEVGQTWASPQPGGATLVPSAPFVVSLGAAPAGRPSAPQLPRLRGAGSVLPGHTARSPRPSQQPAMLLPATVFLGPANRLPGASPKPPDPSAALAASDFPASSCPSVGPESAPGAPMSALLGRPAGGGIWPPRLRSPRCRPLALSSVRRARGAPSSHGQLCAPGPKMGPGSTAVLPGPWGAAAAGRRGGGSEGAGAVWAAGGIPGSAQTGPGAARCEMRRAERPGQRAGGGRRTSSASRRPPAPGARRLCATWPSERRARPILATSAGHFVCWLTVRLSRKFDRLSSSFSSASPPPLLHFSQPFFFPPSTFPFVSGSSVCFSLFPWARAVNLSGWGSG